MAARSSRRRAPVRYAESLARLFSRRELHVIENAGHWPFIDAPERTREIVVAFLRALTTV